MDHTTRSSRRRFSRHCKAPLSALSRTMAKTACLLTIASFTRTGSARSSFSGAYCWLLGCYATVMWHGQGRLPQGLPQANGYYCISRTVRLSRLTLLLLLLLPLLLPDTFERTNPEFLTRVCEMLGGVVTAFDANLEATIDATRKHKAAHH